MKELHKVISWAVTCLFGKDVVTGHSASKLSEGVESPHVASNLK